MNHRQYVMHDQVNNLIPSLMESDNKQSGSRLQGLLQLAVFGLATLSYITALSLTA